MTRHKAFVKVTQRVAAELGEEIARRVVALFVAEAGGERMMIPDEHDLFIQERNHRIRMRFRGGNLEELALRYSISVCQVRRIVAG